MGQLFQVGVRGTTATDAARELVAEHAVGGVVLFDRNVGTADGVARLAASLQRTAREATGLPLFLSVDQEGGTVARLPFGATPPSAMAVGAADDPDLARAFGRAVGRQLRAVGLSMDFAPVLDVNNNPENPVIGTRSLGSDPGRVAALGREVAAGLRDAGVVACGKHFPGHGDTDLDSHETLPVVPHGRDRLDAVELRPFRAAAEAGVDALMTAHVSFPELTGDPDLPATLSPAVLTDLLRGDLGFEGLVVTDCMEMAAIADGPGTVEGAVRAVAAGADQVLVSHTPALATEAIDAVVAAVREGRIAESRVDEACRRVLRTKADRLPGGLDGTGGAAESPGAATAGDTSDVVAVSRRVARRAVTVHRDEGGLVPLPDRPVAVWDPRPDAGAPAAAVETLADHLRDRGVEAHAAASDPDAAAGAGPVLAVAQDAAADPAQAEAVRAAAADAPLAALAVSNPYDLAQFGAVGTCATTYDATPAMLAAAADVLAGEVAATGSLPVGLE